MSKIRRDPLLVAARSIVQFFIGVALLVTTATVILSPAIHFVDGAEKLGRSVTIAGSVILLLVAAMSSMAFIWLRELRRIIDSVREANPFAPENADRLSRMAKLSLAINCIAIPTGVVAAEISTRIEGAKSDFGFSLGGLLLAMVLFILARVFREGAQMKADIEGVV
ncbi:MAG: DUF2975 domain-containing protein [Sphingomonadaceae bacterium]